MDSPDSRARLRITLEILLIIALCSVLVIFGISSGAFSPRDNDHRVTLRVTGGGGFVNITYSTSVNPDVVSKQISTPWESTMNLESGTEVYLTAANTGQTGDIECTILLDRKVWKRQTARAPSSNVACAGIVP